MSASKLPTCFVFIGPGLDLMSNPSSRKAKNIHQIDSLGKNNKKNYNARTIPLVRTVYKYNSSYFLKYFLFKNILK